MIQQSTIQRIANERGVRFSQIYKDYIISWLLWGIARNKVLSEALIFKGGTCLKKIHFGEYRYSEDMDFTIHPNVLSTLTNEEIYNEFDKVFDEIYETARIKFEIPEDSKDIYEANNSIKFEISYQEPTGAKNSVKVDATRGEVLEFDLKYLPIIHEYEDLQEEQEVQVQSYSLEEVMIEKMVALMSRVEPRDLYDFDYLTDEVGLEIQDVYREFVSKAVNKGRNHNQFIDRLSRNESRLKQTWEKRLNHQIKDLHDFDESWKRVEKQFKAFQGVT